MTESTKNADFRRKPQIFADSPLLLEIPAFGGRRKQQETADFRRKPKIFAGISNRRLSSVTLGPSPLARPYFGWRIIFQQMLRTPRSATEPRGGPTRNFHKKCRKKYSPAPKLWRAFLVWSAANGCLRDGGLSKSEDI